MTIKVAINGFGRIGRNFVRCSKNDPSIEVVGVNDITKPEVLAHLLKYDSVLRKFDGSVELKDGNLLVDGKPIKVFSEKDPAKLDWSSLGAQVVVESTGLFTEAEKAKVQLKGTVKKVVISAPGKNVDGTFCIGINMDSYDPAKHHVISNASCTTNCLAPLAKVLDEKFEIESGFMTTIHSYTNDQNLLDLQHRDLRRARGGGEHGPEHDRCGQGHRACSSETGRETGRHRDPGPDSERFPRRSGDCRQNESHERGREQSSERGFGRRIEGDSRIYRRRTGLFGFYAELFFRLCGRA